jgi:hypothetical protein
VLDKLIAKEIEFGFSGHRRVQGFILSLPVFIVPVKEFLDEFNPFFAKIADALEFFPFMVSAVLILS